MAAPVARSFPSKRETTNFARLCRFLVDVGSDVLREIFDKKRPPGNLDTVLSSPPVHSVLQSLRKKRILNPLQWGKLYPAIKSSVSSKNFDITLLMVLLRNICGLVRPATGWDKLPPAADTSTEADIVRIKCYRNTVYGHANEASVDDPTFNQHWMDIQDALVRLGGACYQDAIDDLKKECMDPDIKEHYQELLKQWVNDEVSIKERLDEFGEQQEKLIRMVGDIKESMVNPEKKTGVEAKEEMPVAALCAKLIKGTVLRGSVVMITSRPDESDKMKDGIVFGRYVDITGFSEQQVKDNIEKYFKENETMKNTVMDHITKNDNLVSFAHIPVLCFLMCSYFKYILNRDESMNTDALPGKTSDLYFGVVNNFLEQHDKKEGIPPEDTLDKLSELAARFLLKKKFLFVEVDMKMFTSEEVENLKASGLLHCGPTFRKSFSEKTTKYFCFTHLTLQEYLAARWFVKSGRKKFSSGEDVSAMVLQFMSGILSQQSDKASMEELLKNIPSSNNLLIAKCLTEYQDKGFAQHFVKKHYSQFNRDGQIEFEKLTDVDCIAVSFLLDVISTLNAEETAGKNQTSFQQTRLPLVDGLYLDSCYFTQTGLRRICKVLEKRLSTITELYLSECYLNDECADNFGQLLPLTKLTDLDLFKSQINDAGVASLCKALQTPTCKVTTLHLSGNQISDAGAASLRQALQTPTCEVTTLDLRDNQITDAGVASLCQVLQTPTCKVTILHLSGNQITDAGVVSLCQALQTPTCKVTVLGLNENQITDAGVVSLCQALQTPTCKVTTLALRENQITDAGVVSLCQALQTPTCKVTTLNLVENQITDAGVVSLCEALQTPTCKVTLLSLGDNQITDSGVVSLCEALQTPTCKVTTLHLSVKRITDAGKECLRNLLEQQPHLDLLY